MHFEKNYRLRHFQTGRYLEIKQTGIEYKASLTNKALKSSVFSMLPQATDSKI